MRGTEARRHGEPGSLLGHMRLRTTAEFSDLTDVLIHRIETGGYAVSVHRMGDYVEVHAVQLKLPCPQHVATVWDGDGREHLYHCCIELARMVGIDRRGGDGR
jgi:hypothetical protein